MKKTIDTYIILLLSISLAAGGVLANVAAHENRIDALEANDSSNNAKIARIETKIDIIMEFMGIPKEGKKWKH